MARYRESKIFGTTLAGLNLDSWILSVDQMFWPLSRGIHSSVVMICIKASTWALKAGNSKNSNTYSMGKYSTCNHLLGRFQLLPLPTFTHYALLIQSISGCLSLRGKIKIQTDHQIPSQQYRGVTEYSEFDWSVCFFVFPR